MVNTTHNKMAQGYTFEQLQKMSGSVPSGGLTFEQLQGMQGNQKAVNTPQSTATFPSLGIQESPLTAALKTIGNIPQSAFNFVKGAITTPIQGLASIPKIPGEVKGLIRETGGVIPAIKAFAKEIPSTTYHALVPEFIRSAIKGDFEAAQKKVEEDPVGQIAPLVLYARGIAEGAGKLSEFDSRMSKVSEMVTKPLGKAGEGTTKVLGTIGKGTLGMTTKKGIPTMTEAYDAGKLGGEPMKAFTEAMRGKTPEETIRQTAKDALGGLYQERSSGYRMQLEQLKKTQPQSHDLSPVMNKFDELSKPDKFNIKYDPIKKNLDLSRSKLVADGKKVRVAINLLEDWGGKRGDRTVAGIDLLKQQLRDLKESNNPPLNSFLDQLAGSAKGIIKDVPGYAKMESEYAAKSELIREIQKDLGLGDKTSVETGLKKMTQALKSDNQLRTDLIKELQSRGADNLLKQLAGLNLKEWTPTDMFRAGFDVYSIFRILSGTMDPTVIAEIGSTSPRLVGEFMRGLGIAARKIQGVTQPILGAPVPFSPTFGASAAIPQIGRQQSSGIPGIQ